MPKNILVVYYSQSGQLQDIVKNIAEPFSQNPDYSVDFYQIQPKEDFPFPWPEDVFYNTFPESYLQIPREIFPPSQEILSKKYDLILFGYQVWFLTPSIPTISFLKSPFAEKLLKNTPVVTISATRNMWMLSQDKLKAHLNRLGTKLVGNIALVDRHDNYTSVITILNWMSTGKKEQKPPLPKAGVSDREIAGARKFGEVIKPFLDRANYDGLQEKLLQKGAVEVRPFLVKVEEVGNKLFTFFSGRIKKNPAQRKFWVKLFKIYLMTAIWIVSPIVLIFYNLTTPIFRKERQKKIQYYKGI
ncbi:dialkylresorcinol condensing enzyme DarA [Cruoricaptor ignavus]|uniref:Dialkylresorcinol condensing enzyme DarA n=1 Tax=Cruoricaptor ignavus TaxID=1118202 RepID=A0A7M1T0V6_9FLAO|nr:dialkylrecorsinol condensing enzyme DarA [Cruoricaptor ignavus]QOR73425.1 dialkylresorcinol condensing enzyme DarA [Cruoricaptor ignavus]